MTHHMAGGIHCLTRQRWDDLVIYTDENFNPILVRRSDLTEAELEAIMALPVDSGPVIDPLWLIEMARLRSELNEQQEDHRDS